MAEKLAKLEDIWPQVMRLSAIDKMKLVERVASWFETELTTAKPVPQTNIGWGSQIVQALESGEIDTGAWIEMEIDDSVRWVKDLRRKEQLVRENRL